MFKSIFLLFLVILCFVLISCSDDLYNIEQENLESEVQIDYKGNIAIPSSQDWSAEFPPVISQFGNNCAVIAGVYSVRTHLEYLYWQFGSQDKTHLWYRNYKVNVYNNQYNWYYVGRNLTTSQWSQVVLEDVLKFMNENGAARNEEYGQYYSLTKPYVASAKNHKISNKYPRIFPFDGMSASQTIKYILVIERQNIGAVLNIPIYDNFVSNNLIIENGSTIDIYKKYTGKYQGRHSVAIVGYDDSKKAFKIQNSYGTSWKYSGYGWISYELIDKFINSGNANNQIDGNFVKY